MMSEDTEPKGQIAEVGTGGTIFSSAQAELRNLLRNTLTQQVQSSDYKVEKLSSVQKACIQELSAIRGILHDYLGHPDMTDDTEETVRLLEETIQIAGSLTKRVENVNNVLTGVENMQKIGKS
jgi:hypothetical protein